MHGPIRPWSQVSIHVSCKGPEGIALVGAWLPGLSGPPAFLAFCTPGWDKRGTRVCGAQTMWEWFSGTTQHVGSSLPGMPGRLFPPSSKGSQKIPTGTQSSPGQEKSITLFWRPARVTGVGPGHSDSVPAWVGEAGLWPAPTFKRKGTTSALPTFAISPIPGP